MPLSLNEIKDRALAFSREWEGERAERAEAQTFWNEFFNVFGVTRRRIATFEQPVKNFPLFEKESSGKGRIDLFWRGTLIAEHKSRGGDLDTAYKQALGYFRGLPERDLPRYVIVSDFARVRLYDLDAGTQNELPLKDLYKNIKLFGFIAGYATQCIEEQDPVNLKAAERMGKLHDRLRASGYSGHNLEVLLVRLLFCLFAEDTTLFEPRGSFRDFIENNTQEDGKDLGSQLTHLFQVLNQREDRRQKGLDEALATFPYVNGRLFEENLPIPTCDSTMRETLLDCCALDWGRISPAIFGALFQCVMDEEGRDRRRNLGAHYTSEENILKLIKPLFLDDLWAEFEAAKKSKTKLFELHKKLSKLKFLDPACGCGNFLVIAYRELRKLELEILRAARATGEMHLDIFSLVQIDVDQFYGIEIEEFPSQIAQVALWLTDHQMNMLVSEEFGQYFRRLPLVHAPNIVCGNALRMDWNEVVSVEEVDYIFGNPPFVGAKFLNDEQRKDMANVYEGVPNYGLLDYVTAWYKKAVDYVRKDVIGNGFASLSDGVIPASEARPESFRKDSGQAGITDHNKLVGALPGRLPRERVKLAFVSTNSITQGEQVGALWSALLKQGLKIHFAHRTFKWSNEARGMAAVHCVIIGFALHDRDRKIIYDYPDINAEPHAIISDNINPYLVATHDVVLLRRAQPLCAVPEIGIGNKPIDGGNYLFTAAEKEAFLKIEPSAGKWFMRWIGSDEFINGYERWCLWLGNCPPEELRKMPEAMKRVDAVRRLRLESKSAPTRKLADTPTRFHVENIPDRPYLVIPKVSSERRAYIPMGFMDEQTLSSDLVFLIQKTTLYHLGILSSAMHMAWVRQVCGRLESRYRYSKDIVYNNFPWPEIQESSNPSRPPLKVRGGEGGVMSRIEQAAQSVLDARAAHPGASLADLYDPIAMPPNLRKAHQELDKAVDAAYGKKSFASDAERVAFLFELYHKYTSLLPAPEKKGKGRKIANTVVKWQNKDKDKTNDKNRDRKEPSIAQEVGSAVSGGEEATVSGKHTGAGARLYGLRGRRRKSQDAERAHEESEEYKTSARTTRYIESRLGIKSYTELVPYLAKEVERVMASLVEKSPDELKITPEFICSLHRDAFEGLFPSWAGLYRDRNVMVGDYEPPPFFELPVLMRSYCDDIEFRLSSARAEGALSETLIEAFAFAEGRLLSIHPFRDFNGRITRMLLFALLRRFDMPPVSLVPDREILAETDEYLKALSEADRMNWQPLSIIWRKRLGLS